MRSWRAFLVPLHREQCATRRGRALQHPPAAADDAALPAIRVGNARRDAKNEQIPSWPRSTCTCRRLSTVNVQGVTLGTTPKSEYV